MENEHEYYMRIDPVYRCAAEALDEFLRVALKLDE